MERLTRFVSASAELTGYEAVELRGTGVAAAHLLAADSAAGAEVIDRLLGAIETSGVDDELLGAADLGPVARNIILLWYTGAWHALPTEWHASFGGDEADETHVVSPAAFLAGLQWKVMGAHAPGGNMQGFGAWAMPPLESAR